jgi:hypothetical protein
MNLRIEDAKFYRDAAGNRVGPMRWTKEDYDEDGVGDFHWYVPNETGRWNDKGEASKHRDFGKRPDLVSQWAEDPAEPVGGAEPAPPEPTSKISVFIARREGALIRMTGVIDNKVTHFYADPSVTASMIEYLAKALAEQNQH